MTHNLSIVILLLPLMIFCHIVDDYYLQGWLASGKQRKWWKENAPNNFYKNDYKAALVAHAFSWSFCINFPMLAYAVYTHNLKPFLLVYLISLILNTAIHAVVDDLKANKHEINLIADQSIHLCQILISWVVYIFVILWGK